jgi:outer membrane protein TolC
MYTGTMEERTNLMRALNIALGADEEREVRVAGAPLPECDIATTNFSYLVARVVERSPSIRSLRAALAAADAKFALEEANAWPDIFLGGGMRFNWANNRPSDDDYNSKGVAVFAGLRWRFDFWRTDTEAELAKNDREAVRHGLRYAEERVRLDIDKAVSDLRQEYLFLASIRESLAAAKTYVRLASDNYDLGLGSSQTVVNGYKTQYELQAAELQSEYKAHAALARLALVLGDIKKYKEWVKNEKVILD